MELKIGDKVRLADWEENKYVEVLDIGKARFWAVEKGKKDCCNMYLDWLPYQEPNEPTQKEIMEFYKKAMQDCQIPTGDLAHMNATEFYKKYHKSNNHQITEAYKQALSEVSGSTVTSQSSNKEPNDDLVKDAIKDYGDDDLENRIVELSEQLKNIKKRVEETLDFVISNIAKQNNRITALEQPQTTTTCDSIKISGGKHPDANDNQPTVKNCMFKIPCSQCSVINTNWEQA